MVCIKKTAMMMRHKRAGWREILYWVRVTELTMSLLQGGGLISIVSPTPGIPISIVSPTSYGGIRLCSGKMRLSLLRMHVHSVAPLFTKRLSAAVVIAWLLLGLGPRATRFGLPGEVFMRSCRLHSKTNERARQPSTLSLWDKRMQYAHRLDMRAPRTGLMTRSSSGICSSLSHHLSTCTLRQCWCRRRSPHRRKQRASTPTLLSPADGAGSVD